MAGEAGGAGAADGAVDGAGGLGAGAIGRGAGAIAVAGAVGETVELKIGRGASSAAFRSRVKPL